jgi:hypothetical protein
MDLIEARRGIVARALLLAAAVLLLAGCGGASRDDYEAGLARVQARLDEANEASRSAAGVEDADERGKALQAAHAKIEAAADVADGLEPPDDVAAAHADLAEALRDYASLFEQLANTPEGDPNLPSLYGTAGTIVERLDEANRALADAGFDVRSQRASADAEGDGEDAAGDDA